MIGGWSKHTRDKVDYLYVPIRVPTDFDPLIGQQIIQGTPRWHFTGQTGYPITDGQSFARSLTGSGTLIAKMWLRDYTKPSQFVLTNDNIDGHFDCSLMSNATIDLRNNSFLTGLTLPVHTSATTRTNITLLVSSCDITGTLVLTGMTECKEFIGSNNSNLTNITFPVPNVDVASIIFGSCDLTGNLDLTSVNTVGAFRLIANDNPNLTGVTFANTTGDTQAIQLYNCNITGTLDLSPISNLGFNSSGDIRLYNNPNLTSITNPDSTREIQIYLCQDCDITGVLNMSGLTGLGSSAAGGIFTAYNNTGMTQVINPLTVNNITLYQVHNCGLTNNLDLSPISGLSGTLYCYNNSSLTGITFPSNISFTSLWAYSCDLTGTFDVSSITGLSGQFRVYSNSNLTDINFPGNSNTFSQIQAHLCDLGYVDVTPISGATGINSGIYRFDDNNMTAAEVNHMLVDFDTISVSGFTSRQIIIDGTNAAPDGTSGGFDGTGATASLVTKGFTVTTS